MKLVIFLHQIKIKSEKPMFFGGGGGGVLQQTLSLVLKISPRTKTKTNI